MVVTLRPWGNALLQLARCDAKRGLRTCFSVPRCLCVFVRRARRRVIVSYHRSTRLPFQIGPSLTYLHSGFRDKSLNDWCTRSKLAWSSAAHSK